MIYILAESLLFSALVSNLHYSKTFEGSIVNFDAFWNCDIIQADW